MGCSQLLKRFSACFLPEEGFTKTRMFLGSPSLSQRLIESRDEREEMSGERSSKSNF